MGDVALLAIAQQRGAAAELDVVRVRADGEDHAAACRALEAQQPDEHRHNRDQDQQREQFEQARDQRHLARIAAAEQQEHAQCHGDGGQHHGDRGGAAGPA